MAGKRVLLATEFVRGGTTLVRLLPLAEALADRGHDVVLAVPPSLKEPAGASGFPVFEAPYWSIRPPPGFVGTSYADVLLHAGYATQDSLAGLLTGWAAVLVQSGADRLVADFAPTAMLAARIAGIGMAALGDGFSLPPLTSPLQILRPWADIPPDAAADVEGRVLAVIATTHPLRRLRDLFDGLPSFLCTFPELDHYPSRPDGSWFGEVFPRSRGPAPVWPAGTGERVYVDLDPRHPALKLLPGVLAQLGLPALCRGPRTTTNLNAILNTADIVVCQGLGVAAPALLAGKPLLMLPVFVEQMMTLHRVASQGLGHGLSPDADAPALDAALRRLVDDRASRARAADFAKSYEGYRPGIAIEAVADDLDERLA